jgi:S-adenosylmethionine/arginine decarboxylase-like enzyme
MKLCPNIFRQRLLIEAIYTIEVNEEVINSYLLNLCSILRLTPASKKPFINCTLGTGKIENQGYEAFLPLIESGISIYTWEKDKFVTILIFTCKEFDSSIAFKTTKEFFKFEEFSTKAF